LLLLLLLLLLVMVGETVHVVQRMTFQMLSETEETISVAVILAVVAVRGTHKAIHLFI